MSNRRQYQNAHDSRSLWNYTLSPGWDQEAGEVLRKAIMRYGCGNWQKIKRHLPDKTNGQLNLQTQRLFGQQALATWHLIHVDPLKIKKINDDKKDAFRKNGCIVNSGDKISDAEKKRLIAENTEKYGIPKEMYRRIKVPVFLERHEAVTLDDKIQKLAQLYEVHRMIMMRKKYLEAGGKENENEISYHRKFTAVVEENDDAKSKKKKLKNGSKKTTTSKTNKSNKTNKSGKKKKNSKKKSQKSGRNGKKTKSKANAKNEEDKEMDGKDGKNGKEMRKNRKRKDMESVESMESGEEIDGMPPKKKQKMAKNKKKGSEDVKDANDVLDAMDGNGDLAVTTGGVDENAMQCDADDADDAQDGQNVEGADADVVMGE